MDLEKNYVAKVLVKVVRSLYLLKFEPDLIDAVLWQFFLLSSSLLLLSHNI